MRGLTNHVVDVLSQHWLAVSCALLFLWLVKNRYHNGLHKYPGPFLASLTDWWRFFDVYGRRPETTHRLLHKKYGDVVRLGPNTLSFSDPRALKPIYGLNKGFTKVPRSHPYHVVVFPKLYGGLSDSLVSLTSTSYNNPSPRVIVCSPCLAPRTTISTRHFADV